MVATSVTVAAAGVTAAVQHDPKAPAAGTPGNSSSPTSAGVTRIDITPAAAVTRAVRPATRHRAAGRSVAHRTGSTAPEAAAPRTTTAPAPTRSERDHRTTASAAPTAAPTATAAPSPPLPTPAAGAGAGTPLGALTDGLVDTVDSVLAGLTR